MATVEECRTALRQLTEQLGAVDAEERAKHVVERTLSCRVPDLGMAFNGRIHEGGLDAFVEYPDGEQPPAQVRFTISSDDLVALVDGSLGLPGAMLTGRVKVEASIGDLFRLRRML